jgi:hypothetical protein
VPFLNCPKISLFSDPPASTGKPSKVFQSPREAFKSALTLVRRPVQSMLTDPIFSPSKSSPPDDLVTSPVIVRVSSLGQK